MKNIIKEIQKFIDIQDKENAVLTSLKALRENQLGVLDLYEDVLKTSLYNIDCDEFDSECIWKEHVKSSIVRSIIENTYEFVLKEKSKYETRESKVLVVCPSEEYHEIGARMAHDYFIINGFDSTFIGANTPLDVILNAVQYKKPTHIAISVTNYYNVVTAKKIIDEIKKINTDIKVIAGGQAFKNEDALRSCQVDQYVETFEDIKGLE